MSERPLAHRARTSVSFRDAGGKMSKHQILAIVAATLLGAFWVYPNIEKTQRKPRGPASVQVQHGVQPSLRPIQRVKTNITPMRVAKKATPKNIARSNFVKRSVRVNFERADRRPTSLPQKKSRPKRNSHA